MQDNKSHILITGANGFIGSELRKCLIQQGLSIRCVVRQSVQPNDLVVEKISADTEWVAALKGIQTIIHLAARVHVMKDIVSNPLEEFRRVNTEATLSLAKQAAEYGVKRFIYLSSIKVNGEATEPGLPFTENDEYVPADPYALSKYEAEQGLLQLAKNTQMEIVIIRPPLVYGPGVKANFYSMMKWVNKGIPLPFGAIHNKRSFVDLDNLIDLIMICIEHPAAANQVFLVSDGQDLSTTELLQHVASTLGIKSRLLPINQKLLELTLTMIGKKGLAQRLCASLQVDISKTKKLLNWEPPVSVDEGLQKTAQYFFKHQPK